MSANLMHELAATPGSRFRLWRVDPADTHGFGKEDAHERLKRNTKRMFDLQYRLYAESRRAMLIVLQAMDAGGKDGTIRHVMSGMNPQGCRVTSFKVPSSEEAAHDYLWRIHHAVPRYGEIGIFNRSHYEDVLVVRVHNLVPEKTWRRRYDQINAFERHLAENNVVIVKFFLHISKKEQKRRFIERVGDPDKNWKFSKHDVEERKHWDEYMQAYDEAIRRCSTPWAPWYVVPSDKKWFRNLAVSEVIVRTLESLKMRFPKPGFDPAKIKIT